MLIAVAPDGSGGGELCPLGPDGAVAESPAAVSDLAAAVAEWEARAAPRWLWASAAGVAPGLLRAGVRVGRCHDVELVEGLLLACAGRWGEPRSAAAVVARRDGRPAPADPPARAAEPPGGGQGALFTPAVAGSLPDVVAGYGDQVARLAAGPEPGRLRLLAAAESAGALVAAEMGHEGLPWRADVHRDLLVELLGAPSPVGGPPARLVELSARIAAAFGVRALHPERPAEVVRAFARAGIPVANTRSWVLRGVDHPAVPLLLDFKERYRIWTAHGWSWLDAWVRDGRFRPEYVPAGVVSGRWATRGGGALQIPRVIRRAVVADPGWRLVVADAGQLEPRVLAAISGDERLAAAGASGDLYAALADGAFGGDRARAKVALLGAMYGQTGGAAVPALAALRHGYPVAWEFLEAAARTGEAGGLVRSWLGRTCPPPSADARDLLDGGPGEPVGPVGSESDGAAARSRARARGRFTRNFVVQATAAEWALTLLATLRTALWGMRARLVFFQHDEVVVHCPADEAAAVTAAMSAAGRQAAGLLFGATPVRFPTDARVVDCYADATH
ncbi:DNA polymerase I [Pilimelia anulata]|uniref:DNA-directed DNA polymerase n=1 Tax=Pilimelia anulata TaxID=53371 RepID=A0A8J3B855_9ACTN|nr:bifunctional 3'-5' exonuclease/DNA polymerase [Pilimelia anulata]GGJ85157.1 DNA polymerase I [Pilimelia anulata]